MQFYRGGSRYGPIRPRPPLLKTKSCKFSLFWGHISQFSLNFDTRPPLFANPGSGPVLDHTPNIEEKKELMIPRNVLIVYKNNATFRPNITKFAYFCDWHFIVFHLTVY